MKPIFSKIEQTAVNTVRILSVDAVQKANSSHPGMPMGAAPMAHMLWAEVMLASHLQLSNLIYLYDDNHMAAEFLSVSKGKLPQD